MDLDFVLNIEQFMGQESSLVSSTQQSDELFSPSHHAAIMADVQIFDLSG
jgi:hypothetical protein